MESKTNAFHYRSEHTSHADEKSVTVVRSDALPSAQYFDEPQARTLEPEKTLMLAVLEDAVRCFQENHAAQCGNRKRIFQNAHAWLFKPSSDWIFSFENVCAVLGFDPQYIRRGLRGWKEKELLKERGAPLWKPLPLRSGTHG
jgi:hypothetical protein